MGSIASAFAGRSSEAGDDVPEALCLPGTPERKDTPRLRAIRKAEVGSMWKGLSHNIDRRIRNIIRKDDAQGKQMGMGEWFIDG